jgi:hypothetical protein
MCRCGGLSFFVAIVNVSATISCSFTVRQKQDRNFEKAQTLFKLVDTIHRFIHTTTTESEHTSNEECGDLAAMLLHERCARLLLEPPPVQWDGAEVLSEKHF